MQATSHPTNHRPPSPIPPNPLPACPHSLSRTQPLTPLLPSPQDREGTHREPPCPRFPCAKHPSHASHPSFASRMSNRRERARWRAERCSNSALPAAKTVRRTISPFLRAHRSAHCRDANTEQRKRHVQSSMASGRHQLGKEGGQQGSKKPGSEKPGMAHSSSGGSSSPKKKKKKHARKHSGTCLS